MHRPLAALPGALAVLVLLSCGGDEGATTATTRAGGAQPAAVKLARTAAGPNAKASSGVISAEGEITIKGVPGFEEPVVNMVSGPFVSTARARRCPTTSSSWASATPASR